jgi:hypothetical protein
MPKKIRGDGKPKGATRRKVPKLAGAEAQANSAGGEKAPLGAAPKKVPKPAGAAPKVAFEDTFPSDGTRTLWGPFETINPPTGELWVPNYADATGALQRHRVAVFGAGVGGLTVAHELAERGFKVHVFELRGESQAGGQASSQWHLSTRARDAYVKMYGAPSGGDIPDHLWLPAEHGFRFFPSFYVHVIDTMKRIPVWDRRNLNLESLGSFPNEDPDHVFAMRASRALKAAEAVIQQPPPPLPPGAAAAGAPPTDVQALLTVVQRIFDWERFRGQVEFFRPPFVAASNLVPTNKTALVFDDGRVLEYDRRKPRSLLGAFAGSFLFDLFGLGLTTRDLALMATRMLQYVTSCRERRLAEYEKMTFWDFMQASNTSPTLQADLGQFTRILLAMDAKRGEARTIMTVLTRMLLDQVSDGTSTDRVLNGPTSERWIVPWVRHLQKNLDVSFHWCTRLDNFVLDANGTIVDAQVTDMKTGGQWLLNPYLVHQGLSPTETERGVPENRERGGLQWNYFVTDLPVGALWNVLQASPNLLNADESQTAALPPRCFPRDNPDPPLRAIGNLAGPDCNPLMSGIQFYLTDPIDLGVPGHLNFVQSKWALSGVVQSQFWGPDFVTRYGSFVVRAILSVDIAEFDVPGEIVPMTLRQLVQASQNAPNAVAKGAISDQIAAEIWHQMAKGLRKWDVRLPEPPTPATPAALGAAPIPFPYLDHHIDWTLCACNPECSDTTNYALTSDGECGHPVGDPGSGPGYFIATPDSWRHRPGPLPRYDDSEHGYRVRLGSVVSADVPQGLLVAGVYAQTFTSLNSMEAANESARHAVNGLIRHHELWRDAHGIPGGRDRYETCMIWPLEELEPADFETGKQIDTRLFSLCDPHAIEIQGQDKMIDYFLGVCNVENRPYTADQLQGKFKEALWILTAFGRYDPF